ncbi:hypothetical protein VTI28DRAFT_1394 [Corynascus sepedonium]
MRPRDQHYATSKIIIVRIQLRGRISETSTCDARPLRAGECFSRGTGLLLCTRSRLTARTCHLGETRPWQRKANHNRLMRLNSSSPHPFPSKDAYTACTLFCTYLSRSRFAISGALEDGSAQESFRMRPRSDLKAVRICKPGMSPSETVFVIDPSPLQRRDMTGRCTRARQARRARKRGSNRAVPCSCM